jgi:hypothetical protein
MQVYEIRVLKTDRSTMAVMEQQFVNDHAAIRSARQFSESQPFEVWRGLDCIYGTHKEAHWEQQHRKRSGE